MFTVQVTVIGGTKTENISSAQARPRYAIVPDDFLFRKKVAAPSNCMKAPFCIHADKFCPIVRSTIDSDQWVVQTYIQAPRAREDAGCSPI